MIKKPHLNIVFIGQVDSGKSSLAGNILYLAGVVDARTIEKYKKLAEDNKRDSWYFAYILDVDEEERDKAITIEVGRATFETEQRRFTIMDAPGHKQYVANMIQGASQADVAILVISARKGEFESGFEKGGSTKEHALLALTLGVKKLIVVVNKMDEKTVMWDKERYLNIITKLKPFLEGIGYKEKNIFYLPISALLGTNIKDIKSTVDYYNNKTLFELLDTIELPERNPTGNLRIPVMSKFKDGGKVWLMGKIEQGTANMNQQVVLMPEAIEGTIVGLGHVETNVSSQPSTNGTDDQDMEIAEPGENIKICISDLDEDRIHSGNIVCNKENPIKVVSKMLCHIKIVDLIETKPIFSAGYTAVIHLATCQEEVIVDKIISEIIPKTKTEKPNPAYVKKGALIKVAISCAKPICAELYREVPQLGSFTLRDEGTTIAIGKIIGLPKTK